jgi:hypothetical protein
VAAVALAAEPDEALVPDEEEVDDAELSDLVAELSDLPAALSDLPAVLESDDELSEVAGFRESFR